MNSPSPWIWFRWGVLALILALGGGDIASNWDSYGVEWRWMVGVVYLVYAGVFLRISAELPRRRPEQVWLLLGLLVISAPLGSNLTVVTMAAIPLVMEKARWRRWAIGTVAAVVGQMVLRSVIQFLPHRAELPPEVTWAVIVGTWLFGVVEILAWHGFAFLAAVLIVRFDEDRRRLALMNAEMKGAQILLMESSRLAERLRISRELHDSLGHHLTSLSLQLEVAEHLPDDELRPQMGKARFLARLLLAEIREAVSEWRGETSAALPEALRTLSEGMPGLAVRLEMEEELPATAPVVTHALFRCVQEALTNAMRHGRAKAVEVRLECREGKLLLRIADDGEGCAAVTAGNGLKGMVARVAEAAGSVTFETAAGKGFRIEIVVPVPELERP